MFTRFRSMPATAMAAVLGGALMTMAAPVAAKEKPKKEEPASQGPKISPSKGFIPAGAKMEAAAKKKDAAALQAAIAEGQPLATTNDDKYFLGFYTLQLGIMNKDEALQDQGLDIALDSGLTPAAELGVYNFYSGRFAYVKKDYAKAVKRFEAAKAAGSTESALPVLLMDSYLNTNQIDQGVAMAKAAIEAEHAAGRVASDELYVRPAKALQTANRINDLLDLLTLRVRDHGTPDIWRNTLFIMLQQSEDKELNLDTLRLMRATNAMAQRPEYMEYSALAVEAGYPAEVISLIDQARDSGKIAKTDARFNEIYNAQDDRAKADMPSLRADAGKAATRDDPKIARSTADGLVGIGDYAAAIPLYEAALAAAPDPVTQYRLGVAQGLAGQKDAAIASFAKVQGNRQRLAQLWTIHLSPAPAAAAAAAPTAAPAAAPATGS